jgi:hypothetical protein
MAKELVNWDICRTSTLKKILKFILEKEQRRRNFWWSYDVRNSMENLIFKKKSLSPSTCKSGLSPVFLLLFITNLHYMSQPNIMEVWKIIPDLYAPYLTLSDRSILAWNCILSWKTAGASNQRVTPHTAALHGGSANASRTVGQILHSGKYPLSSWNTMIHWQSIVHWVSLHFQQLTAADMVSQRSLHLQTMCPRSATVQ